MITLPTLFKKASSGKMQMWSIGVDKNVIVVNHGQLGGKITRDEETIKEGKNVGRSNETTPAEQALAEATSKWEKKLSKKGYVEDLQRAEADENDFKGGYKCMLAHKHRDFAHKIAYPAYEQPKLNGHRCTAVIVDGICTLWSREHEPINSCPHIVEELQRVYPTGTHEPDGELYNHAYKDRFEDLASLIRQEEPEPGHTDIEYHLYDKRMEGGFEDRIEHLATELHTYEKAKGNLKYLKLVETVLVKDEDEMFSTYQDFIERGYEGGMARNAKGPYVGKRSYDLQKIKSFLDDDWAITSVKEGRGTYVGCAIFQCRIATAKHAAPCVCKDCAFDVKMRGPQTRLREFFANPKLWQGKTLVVSYQYISKYGVPIFPVGERFKA